MSERPRFTTVDEYLAGVPSDVRLILEEIRALVKRTVPDTQEAISYQMPAFRRKRVFFFYAAFKKHIGIYPPLHGDEALEQELLPYRGEKGNLKFPLDRPMPYDLIARVAAALAQQAAESRAAMGWDVLLIGGHSTSGKSTVAANIGKRLGVPVSQVDDHRIGLQRVTHPGQIEGIHFFLQPEAEIFRHPMSVLVERHVRIATVMSRVMEAVIAHHVLVKQPIILEGDGILPELGTRSEIDDLSRWRGACARSFSLAAPMKSSRLPARARWPGAPGPHTEDWTKLAWHYGQWMRGECERHSIPIVESQPWATLEERVLELI